MLKCERVERVILRLPRTLSRQTAPRPYHRNLFQWLTDSLATPACIEARCAMLGGTLLDAVNLSVLPLL